MKPMLRKWTDRWEERMVDPIRKLIVVQCDADTAFRIFAEQTTDWWPLA